MRGAFSLRGLAVHPEEFDREMLEMCAEAKLNYLALHPVGGAEAARSLDDAIAAHALPESRALRLEARLRGIEINYEAHALSWLLPRSLFDRRSEWFRMNERGERVREVNLCASCEEALAYVAERAQLLARLLDVRQNKYFLWLDDASGAPCRCPDCRALSASDQQMRVVNAVLTGLRRANPSAQLCYLAYGDALQPPRRVEPLTGAFLEYAPFRRDLNRPLNDPDCAQNRCETAAIHDLLACFGAKNARALDYWLDNSLRSGWKKPPKRLTLAEDVLEADLDFYARLGFEEIVSFGCYLGADYRALYGTPPVVPYGERMNRRA